jgi:hypothetical protein
MFPVLITPEGLVLSETNKTPPKVETSEELSLDEIAQREAERVSTHKEPPLRK